MLQLSGVDNLRHIAEVINSREAENLRAIPKQPSKAYSTPQTGCQSPSV